MLGLLRHRQSVPLLARDAKAMANLPRTVALLTEELPYNPWWAAPGAGTMSHHPYPGGWLIHNATNLGALKGLIATAATARGKKINADLLTAAMLLHDWAKPRLFVWRERELHEDQGEAGHHVTALAEAALRGFPDELLILLAGIHGGWWRRSADVAKGLEQTGELLGLAGIAHLARQQEALRYSMAAWIMRQGEEAWYSAAKQAVQYVAGPLRHWIERRFPNGEHGGIEQLVWGWADELELAEGYARGGDERLEAIALVALEKASEAFQTDEEHGFE